MSIDRNPNAPEPRCCGGNWIIVVDDDGTKRLKLGEDQEYLLKPAPKPGSCRGCEVFTRMEVQSDRPEDDPCGHCKEMEIWQ